MTRELRVEARHWANHGLRVLAGMAAVGVFLAVAFTADQPPIGPAANPFGSLGATLFGGLNGALFLLIWTIGPWLTADCLSREVREGTLGLLLLTPLSGRGVVAGKGLVHGLRAATLLLSVAPLLSLPLVLGGVGWRDLILAMLLDSASLALVLSAGLLASCWTRRKASATALASVLGGLGLVALLLSHGSILNRLALGAYGWDSNGFLGILVESFAVATSCGLVLNVFGSNWPSSVWDQLWPRLSPSGQAAWLWLAGLLLLVAVLVLAASVQVGAWRVRRSCRETPPPAWWRRLCAACGEVVVNPAFLRRNMRASRELNPVGWLQRYSVGLRLSKWLWCGVVMVLAALFGSSIDDFCLFQKLAALVLVLGLSWQAVLSFNHERETGALELLLVTPLPPSQIINGRLRGVWMQFLPSLALVALIVSFLESVSFSYRWTADGSDALPWLWPLSRGGRAEQAALSGWLVGSFVTLPAVGFCLAAWGRSVLSTWVCALLAGLALPVVAVRGLTAMGLPDAAVCLVVLATLVAAGRTVCSPGPRYLPLIWPMLLCAILAGLPPLLQSWFAGWRKYHTADYALECLQVAVLFAVTPPTVWGLLGWRAQRLEALFWWSFAALSAVVLLTLGLKFGLSEPMRATMNAVSLGLKVLLTQLAVGGTCWWVLRHRLQTRRFALEPHQGNSRPPTLRVRS